ncbi:MAG: hypothetical protein ACRD50_02985 [Candidatus Acidiferrales bacterium]
MNTKKKRKATAKPSSKKPIDHAAFAATFAALKKIFAPHAARLQATVDKPDRYYVVVRGVMYKRKPLFLGAVISGKAYVSFHLLPLYMNPALHKQVSPELKKRMQGKACFNFTEPDPALFRQLGKLTATGVALFCSKDFPEKLAKLAHR